MLQYLKDKYSNIFKQDKNMFIQSSDSFFEMVTFDKKDIKNLYVNKNFENALNYYNDVITLGAYKENQLVALAGADEIEKRGALPFYTTWSPNLASTAVALNTGFFPTWVGYYAENI